VLLLLCSAGPSSPTLEHEMMFIGVYQPNSPGSYSQVSDFARLTGFSPRILSYYSTFTQPFNAAFAVQAQADGATVLVQWQPRGTTSGAVASGADDAYIHQFAQDVSSDDRQVIISYGQEMNGNWYPWGFGTDTPATYIAAWQHIWNIFAQEGVHNVTWLWGPNIQYGGGPPLSQWYPGDAYVTWVGLDGYFGHPADTFASLFAPSVKELRTFTQKPLLIAESGVTGAAGAAQLAELFAGAAQAGAIGVVYFDEAQTGDAMHQDWLLEHNPANLAAFRDAVDVYAVRPLRL
jgi:mannan endo-1,4-beta-mannosidase